MSWHTHTDACHIGRDEIGDEDLIPQISGSLPVCTDWAIYCTLGNFSKPVLTIILPNPPTFLGKKIKGVKNFHFSCAIISGPLFIGLWWLFTGHPGLYNGSLILGHFLRTDATRSSPSSLRRSQRWDKGQDSLRLTSKNWTPFTNVRRRRKWSRRRRSSPSRRAPMPIRMDFALLGKLIWSGCWEEY